MTSDAFSNFRMFVAVALLSVEDTVVRVQPGGVRAQEILSAKVPRDWSPSLSPSGDCERRENEDYNKRRPRRVPLGRF